MKRFLTVLILLLTVQLSEAQEIRISLKKILYSKDCKCGDDNPILVKVQFNSEYTDFDKLDIVVKNENSTYTNSVKEFDEKGNVFYSFCSKIGETNNFEIYFRNKLGQKSETYEISATAESYNIK